MTDSTASQKIGVCVRLLIDWVGGGVDCRRPRYHIYLTRSKPIAKIIRQHLETQTASVQSADKVEREYGCGCFTVTAAAAAADDVWWRCVARPRLVSIQVAMTPNACMAAGRSACGWRLSRVCIDNGALTRFISETDFPRRASRPASGRLVADDWSQAVGRRARTGRKVDDGPEGSALIATARRR